MTSAAEDTAEFVGDLFGGDGDHPPVTTTDQHGGPRPAPKEDEQIIDD